MDLQAAHTCYLCSQGILGPLENWKGHHAHPECVQNATTYRPVPRRGNCPVAGCYLPDGHSGSHEAADGAQFGEGPTAAPVKYPEPPYPGETVLTGPVFSNFGDGYAGVNMRFPAELVGPDCPDAGLILKEIQIITELLLTKNRAYGSSFRKSVGVFSKLSPVEAINARMDDKIARMQQSKDFSEDTELDLMGYLVLKRVLLREQQAAMKAEETAAVKKTLPAYDDIETMRAGRNLGPQGPPCPEVSLNFRIARCGSTNPHDPNQKCSLPSGHTGLHQHGGPVASWPNPVELPPCEHICLTVPGTRPCHLPRGHEGPHKYPFSCEDTASCKPAPAPSSPARPGGPESSPAPVPGAPPP